MEESKFCDECFKIIKENYYLVDKRKTIDRQKKTYEDKKKDPNFLMKMNQKAKEYYALKKNNGE